MRDRVRRTMWLSMALLALVFGGCNATAPAQRPAAPRATATATPLPTLAWMPVKTPADFTSSGANLAISPVDGHDAWMCQATSATTYVIWKTTDTGQSWQQIGGFRYTAPMADASCGLNADLTGTSALLVTMSWGCGECGTLSGASLFSADGATHWTPLSGYVMNGQFATVQGGVIAVVAKSAATAQAETQYLAFSADGFQTWRAMSARGLPTQFFRFAVSPDGSTLIGAGYNDTLWRSSDLGAHWTQLPSPDGQQTGLNVWLPQRQTFLLCGNNIQAQSQTHCSTDYGAHWNQVTIPSYTTPCPVAGKCGQGVTTQTQQCLPGGLESDGTMITQCLPNQTTPLPPSGPASTVVYLLSLGATTWRPVGVTECSVSMVPASGPDWCASATADQIVGYVTGQLPG